MNYVFENDAAFSEYYEQLLINHINQHTSFTATKTTEKGYPDIQVTKAGAKFYIEVKVQRRTFMTVEKNLPDSGLKPSETVALNLSDLTRYFELEQEKKIHVFIFWVLLNRPCILGGEESSYYYRLASELKPIWEKEGEKRKFRRKSGEGDEVDGKHLGVTVNYHFSLKELKIWKGKLG
ncbi:hypothetical protein [Pedobacter sp. SL55]|uniref:hypothetical protein n=1 Tax=Pedobacter sp. SL55 TaxID=2995161 RepID=UPI0022704686|nr:hypothetical protein [Pedobacter sp. SL55]WAC40478.1 hypothetical protein OVA16_18210 [Pedobacter sp. SL55]